MDGDNTECLDFDEKLLLLLHLDYCWANGDAPTDVWRPRSNSFVDLNSMAVKYDAEVCAEISKVLSCRRSWPSKSSGDIFCRMAMSASVSKNSSTSAELETAMTQLQTDLIDSRGELNLVQHLNRFRFAIEEKLYKLKRSLEDLRSFPLRENRNGLSECVSLFNDEKFVEIYDGFDDLNIALDLVFEKIRKVLIHVNDSISELRWEKEWQEEVCNIITQDCLRGIRDGFELKYYKLARVIESSNKSWQSKLREISAIREELHAISSLLEFNQLPFRRHDISEDKNLVKLRSTFSGELLKLEDNDGIVKTDHEGNLEKSDFRHLNHLTKEDTIAYFRSQIANMKRHHDLSLQQKTEEIFELKRRFYNGTLSLMADKELENVRKRISDIIFKIDRNLLDVTKLPTQDDKADEIERLKGRIDSLYYENQHLRGLLVDERKEKKRLSFQLSESRRKMLVHSSLEAKLLKKMEKIEIDHQNLQIEGYIRHQLDWTIIRELIEDSQRDSLETTCNTLQSEITLLRYFLLEKDKALSASLDENQKLRQASTILLSLMDDDEEEELNGVLHKCGPIKSQENKETTLTDLCSESDSLMSKLEEIMELFKVDKLNSSSETSSDVAEEPMVSNSTYQGTSEELQKISSLPSVFREKYHHCLLMNEKHLQDSKENRVDTQSDQAHPLVQQAISFRRKSLNNKQMLQSTQCELQKVAAEVDFLSSKVTSLLGLLRKLYATLDHYAPVFQHNPGLLDAFLKTSQLAASLRNGQEKSMNDGR